MVGDAPFKRNDNSHFGLNLQRLRNQNNQLYKKISHTQSFYVWITANSRILYVFPRSIIRVNIIIEYLQRLASRNNGKTMTQIILLSVSHRMAMRI